MIRTLKYLNLLFFIIMVCINALANALPIGHGNTGAISEKYPNLFTPAPITFSIWGVIYILVAFFITYQFGIFNSTQLAHSVIRLVGPWFIVSCLMNIGWIFSWHYDRTGLSMVFMIGLLLSLIIITSRLSPVALGRSMASEDVPFLAKLCTYTFDIYLGWIVAATIANMSVLLVKIQWNRFGLSEEFLTVVVLIVGAFIGMLFMLTSNRYMSAFAIIWAYCGILIKHISQAGYAGTHPTIIVVTIIGIFMILAAGLIRVVQDMETMVRMPM